MANYLTNIGGKIFPEIISLATAIHKRRSYEKTKKINWVKDFKHAGYVRKIHSISSKGLKDKSRSYYISESTFFTHDERTSVRCFDKEYLLLSDYYTDHQMTFFNKLTLVQCDFSLEKNYKIICIQDAPHNKVNITDLESSIANTLSTLENIKII